MRAVLYGRFSTDRQNPQSAEDQLALLRKLARRNGWEVVGEFADPGISGGTAKRPGYQKMLALIRTGAVDVIVSEDLKRLWREQAEQWRCIKEMIDRGVHVVTNSGIDSRQAGFTIIASTMGAAAELERTEASYRTRRGRDAVAARGKSAGGKAFGYTPTTATASGLTINEAEAAVVRRIFAEFAAGASCRTIASALNSERVPAPGASWNRTVRRQDGRWLNSTVRAMVRNARYTGLLVHGKTRWTTSAADSSIRRLQANPEAPTIHQREELRIISDELWTAAKARFRVLSAAATSTGGKALKYPLSGLLRCGACGCAMTISDRANYRCSSFHGGGVAACSNSLKVNRASIERTVSRSIVAQLSDPALLEAFGKALGKAIARRTRPAESPQARLTEVTCTIERLTAGIVSGALSGIEAIGAQLRELEAERATLQAQLKAPVRQVVEVHPAQLRPLFARAASRLPTLMAQAPERARDLARRLVGEVRVAGHADGGATVEYSLTGERLLGLTQTGVNPDGSGGRI